MEKKYIAHINEELKTEQTVKEHSENVAMLAEEYAVERFKKIAYVTGLLHDCGKYQESFQKRISGSDIRVEHSTCGAIIVKDMSENKSRYPLGILSRMMEYCIAGHHSGIPDGGTTNDYETDPTLTGRLKREWKKYHLSTYMTALDRAIVLKNIRKDLKYLEKDFPDFKNVSEERQITIVSTSLIEAGVDLDVYTVFRELKGLDNILQAGGRCNREGKREKADVFVFEMLDSKKKAISVEMDITRDLLKKYEDISDSACIEEYYERIFSLKEDSISQNTMHCICDNFRYIPFKKYAENFELIDSRTVSLVVPRDEKSRQMVADLKYKQTVDERKLQNYTCSLYKNELEDLMDQKVVDDFGTGIYCLTNLDYYDEELGLLFEASDYFL